jgi:serine/threonine protein kinase/Tol biopolymer transport system component
MSLPSGSQLGPYTIASPLGAGGMGEVYRAHDPRLGRDVAVKVLPASSAADGDRLQRFEQEARAAAALNHPNILALYDLGRSDAGPYLVTELLEGDTLRAAFEGGAMPTRKAIGLAVQIARGLSAAHDKGIIHRDLKPENVFVTSDGHAKILDFGLAKLVEPQPGDSLLTTAAPGTTPGMVLGTVGYMAPEQVRGQSVDHRADIFAFGAMLYEMLSGRRAFLRDTPAETMTAILNESPPELSLSSANFSLPLPRIVSRCLEKSPAARFQSAGDLAFALDALSGSSASTGPAVPAISGSSPRLTWIAAAVALLALLALAATMVSIYSRPVASDDRLIRFTFTLPPDWTIPLPPASALPLTVSPDGQSIVMRAVHTSGTTSLLIRRLDEAEARQLPGTVGVETHFWSPDSGSIAFTAGGKLHRLDLAGGPSVVLAEAPDATSGAWGPSGVIILGSFRGMQQVPASGGKLTTILPLAENEVFFTAPYFLSDGRRYIFVVGVGTAVRGGGARQVAMATLGSQDRTLLFDTNVFATPIGVARGQLLFVRGNSVMAQAFDETRAAATGEPVPVVSGVRLPADRPYGVAGVSSGGVLAYVPETNSPTHELAWFDRSGKRTAALAEKANYSNVEITRDGKAAVLSILDPLKRTRDIWTLDLARGLRTRLTFDAGEERSVVWSKDDARVIFNARRTSVERDLFAKNANGSGGETTVLADGLSKDPMSVSPGGRLLLYRVLTSNRNDLWVQPLDGSGKAYPFLADVYDENYGQFSPDGQWVAYSADESGQPQVYVVPFPGKGGKWQVSSAGGSYPRWRADGRELFYLTADGRVMAVPVDTTAGAFRAKASRMLFQASVALQPGYQYAVTGDGQRFLINTAAVAPVPVNVISDWTLALKK